MRTVLLISLAGVVLVAICGCTVTANDVGDGSVAPVTYCELMKNPKRYHDKVVRVNAVFERGFEKSSLFDEERGCGKPAPVQSEVWVTHDESFVMDGDSDEAKMNRTVSGFGKWKITALGRFRQAEGPQRFGHLGCCKYEFALIKIEKSEKLPTPK